MSPRQRWPTCWAKNGQLSIVFFSVQGTGGSPTGPDPENRVGDQDIWNPVGHFLLGCNCPVSRAIVVQEQDNLGELPGRFPSKCPSIAPAEMNNSPSCYFGPLEDSEWGGCRLDPKKIKAKNFQADFCTRNFLGRVVPLCRHYIDCCFVSGS